MQVLLGSSAVAHFFMTSPPTWLDPHGIHQFEGGRSSAGCTGEHAPGAIDRRKQGCIMEWYTNDTTIPGNSTIAWDSPLITYKQVCGQDPSSRCCGHDPVGAYAVCDWTNRNPWRAPGSAPIVSPCGFDGGNPQGCPPGNPDPRGCAQGGYGHGPDGRSLRGVGQRRYLPPTLACCFTDHRGDGRAIGARSTVEPPTAHRCMPSPRRGGVAIARPPRPPF